MKGSAQTDLDCQAIRIALIQTSTTPRMRELVSDRLELTVGRPDAASLDAEPDIDLSPDRQVSRQHALLRFRDGRWRISDCGSRHGTLVNGEDIRGRGEIELSFGASVRTGGTTWTILPSWWWCTRSEDIVVAAACTPMMNYAAHHCGVPLIRKLIVANGRSERLVRSRLRLQLIGFSGRVEVPIPDIDPGESVSLPVPAMVLDSARLRLQAEPVHAPMQLEICGPLSAAVSRQITILGFCDWSFDPGQRRTLAAFVSPRNPIVDSIVTESQAKYGSEPLGRRTFRELIGSREDGAERTVLRALYEYLTTERQITYVDPRLSFGDIAEGYQTIRPPHRVWRSGDGKSDGQGTCIDIAVLMASCLERVGLHPVIILTGHLQNRPRHALVGCWVGSAPAGRAVIEDTGYLLGEIRAARLYVVESTGVTKGTLGVSEPLSFGEASQRAEELLARIPWISCLSISAVRPPLGAITPMESPYEPEVLCIHDAAHRLAVRQGARNVEMSHLMCSFLLGRAEVARRLCGVAGVDISHIERRLEKQNVRPSGIPGPTPTQNFTECIQLAERIAREAGYSTVREQDLAWAILYKSGQSEKLQGLCRFLGIDLDQLSAALSQLYPRPIVSSTQTYSFG